MSTTIEENHEQLLTAVHFSIMDLRRALDQPEKFGGDVKSAYERLCDVYSDPTDASLDPVAVWRRLSPAVVDAAGGLS